MNNASFRSNQNVSRWVPAVAAAALLGAVVIAGVAGGSGSGGGGAVGTTPTIPAVQAEPVASTIRVPPATVVDDSAAVQKVALGRTLSNGLAGEDVERVQARLTDLGFDPGPVDGIYGSRTIQAVWAYEKLVLQTPREEATGRVTAEMWDGMQDPMKIAPRRNLGNANHTEIYLPEQVLAVFHAGEPVLVAHISTGELDAHGQPAEWCEVVTYTEKNGKTLDEPVEKDICGRSKTPGGVHKFYRRVAGNRQSALGGHVQPRVLQLRHRRARCDQRAAAARLARLRAAQHGHRQVFPRPGREWRPGVRVERRQGAGERHRRRCAPAFRLPESELDDHDVHHHHDHDHDDSRSHHDHHDHQAPTTTAVPTTTAAPAPATTTSTTVPSATSTSPPNSDD